MNTRSAVIAVLAAMALLACSPESLLAQANDGGRSSPGAPAIGMKRKGGVKPSSYSGSVDVAVLDLAVEAPVTPEFGRQVTEILNIVLSGRSEFQLVDGTKLGQALDRRNDDVKDFVKLDSAVEIGQAVGARVIIVGKVFSIDDRLYLTAKLIGVDTRQVAGVLVKGGEDDDVSDLAMKFAEKVRRRLRLTGSRLVAQKGAMKSPLPTLKESFSKFKKPAVALAVDDLPDPAKEGKPDDPELEREIKTLLRRCGFRVRKPKGGDSASQRSDSGADSSVPKELEKYKGVDYVISAKSSVESTSRIGELVSCSARVTIQVIAREDGSVLLEDSATARAVSRSKADARKKALEKARCVASLRALERLRDFLEVEP